MGMITAAESTDGYAAVAGKQLPRQRRLEAVGLDVLR
jgi:hypothetical protein